MEIFPKSHMQKILQTDIDHIKSLLATIRTHHRQARTLNFLGTAIKIIAGTPDFDDFHESKFQQNKLIEAKNRQIEIITKISQQIEKLTSTVNSLISAKKTH